MRQKNGLETVISDQLPVNIIFISEYELQRYLSSSPALKIESVDSCKSGKMLDLRN